MDKGIIQISGLHVSCIIGTLAWEQQHPQKLIIDLSYYFNTKNVIEKVLRPILFLLGCCSYFIGLWSFLVKLLDKKLTYGSKTVGLNLKASGQSIFLLCHITNDYFSMHCTEMHSRLYFEYQIHLILTTMLYQ